MVGIDSGGCGNSRGIVMMVGVVVVSVGSGCGSGR